MADNRNLLQRLLNLNPTEKENRAVLPTIPARSDVTVVTAESAITLTAVYRALQILATPISKMELETYRIDTRIDNPLFVNNPSLDDTRRNFLFQTVTSMGLTGEAFWLKRYNSAGQVNSVTILPTNSVSVRLDDFGNIVYDYMGITYNKRDIEHIKLFTLPGNLRGVGPIQTCSADIAGVLDLRSYASNWFAQSGVPTGVLTTNAMITKEQADEARSRWIETQRTRQIAVLGNGYAYDPVALSPKDALFTDVQTQAVQAIARLFGIPARLLLTGVDGTSDTYSNLTDEDAVFHRHTLVTYTDAIEDALSNCLPRGTSVSFNYESLFKADIKTRYDYYAVGISNGFLTAEEVRMKEGI